MADTNFDSIATTGGITAGGTVAAAAVSGTTVSAPADGVRSAGEIVPSRLPITYRSPSTPLDEAFFIADRAYEVVSIRESHAVAATATATPYVQVTKDTGTQAPGAGTDLLTNNTNSGFDLSAAANTVQSASLTTAAGVTTLAAGNRLSVDFATTAAPLAGVAVTVLLKPV